MTLDTMRTFIGTPSIGQLTTAPLDENLQFVRYLVDPRKAQGKRLVFTIVAEGDERIRRVELRNSVLVISDADPKAPVQVDLTRRELAEFIRGKSLPVKGGNVLAQLDQMLDRSQLMPLAPDPQTTLEVESKDEVQRRTGTLAAPLLPA